MKLGLVGVGLIGGSLALALKRAGFVDGVVACGRSQVSLDTALQIGIIDAIAEDPAAVAKAADIVVVATPLGQIESTFEKLAPVLDDKTLLTDVGSSKASVLAAAQRAFGELPANFVAGHPIAGTERSGPSAAFAELYENRRVILTPHQTSSGQAVQTIEAMWQAAGAHVSQMSAEHHDEVLAATSHLPHVLAYQLVDTLAAMEERQEIFAYAAGGFRDFTRIASSSPEMWRDIVHNNREAVLAVLDQYTHDLARLREAIVEDDEPESMRCFTRAKNARDGFCAD